MDKKILDILEGAKVRAKVVVDLMESIELLRSGVDVDGATHYTSKSDPQLDIDRSVAALTVVVETLEDAIDELKKIPEASYKERVFDLISSRPIPGVESIEVNESQRKFLVKYRYVDAPKPIGFHDSKTNYTLDQLEALWKAYQWQLAHDLPDVRIENFIKFIEKPMEIYCHSNGDIDRIEYKE